MTVTVKKVNFSEQQTLPEGKLLQDNYLDLVNDLEVECQVLLGTISLNVAELKQLQQGQTLTLKQKTLEPVDLLVNNQVIARGELMSCDDCFAIQITEIAL